MAEPVWVTESVGTRANGPGSSHNETAPGTWSRAMTGRWREHNAVTWGESEQAVPQEEGAEGWERLFDLEHVCHAVFLQGFLVCFSRHQRVRLSGVGTNGSVKEASALRPD
ncbi:hypothetical protein WMY93_006510 [Mugilogobius chulae]|uniref:Uncharacterized protein n=1 Tax=Mugilogobius chulae TaxID=88201 RepID=A0AAW0PKU1_9GOBI